MTGSFLLWRRRTLQNELAASIQGGFCSRPHPIPVSGSVSGISTSVSGKHWGQLGTEEMQEKCKHIALPVEESLLWAKCCARRENTSLFSPQRCPLKMVVTPWLVLKRKLKIREVEYFPKFAQLACLYDTRIWSLCTAYQWYCVSSNAECSSLEAFCALWDKMRTHTHMHHCH